MIHTISNIFLVRRTLPVDVAPRFGQVGESKILEKQPGEEGSGQVAGAGEEGRQSQTRGRKPKRLVWATLLAMLFGTGTAVATHPERSRYVGCAASGAVGSRLPSSIDGLPRGAVVLPRLFLEQGLPHLLRGTLSNQVMAGHQSLPAFRTLQELQSGVALHATNTRELFEQFVAGEQYNILDFDVNTDGEQLYVSHDKPIPGESPVLDEWFDRIEKLPKEKTRFIKIDPKGSAFDPTMEALVERVGLNPEAWSGRRLIINSGIELPVHYPSDDRDRLDRMGRNVRVALARLDARDRKPHLQVEQLKALKDRLPPETIISFGIPQQTKRLDGSVLDVLLEAAYQLGGVNTIALPTGVPISEQAVYRLAEAGIFVTQWGPSRDCLNEGVLSLPKELKYLLWLESADRTEETSFVAMSPRIEDE